MTSSGMRPDEAITTVPGVGSTEYMDNNPTTKSWRDSYKVYPAADVFPMMSPVELKELAEDIKQNGLREKITLWRDPRGGERYLIDGRNRMEAMAMAGKLVGTSLRDSVGESVEMSLNPDRVVDYIISKNIHRRHLTPSDRARLATLAIQSGEEFNRSCNVARSVKRDTDTGQLHGSEKGVAGRVAAAAGVSKHTALEQVEVAHDPELNRKVEAKEITPQQAGREVRDRKVKKVLGFPIPVVRLPDFSRITGGVITRHGVAIGPNETKPKRLVPSVGAILEQLSGYIGVVTRDVTGLLPHKESVRRDASFRNLVKKVGELQALLAQFEPPKSSPEPMRTAEPVMLPMEPAVLFKLAAEVKASIPDFAVGQRVEFRHKKHGGVCYGTIAGIKKGQAILDRPRTPGPRLKLPLDKLKAVTQ